LQFCKLNICLILNDIRQLLNSAWWSLPDSPFHDGSYTSNKRQIWTAGTSTLQNMQNEAWHRFASQERCHLDANIHLHVSGTFTQMQVTHAVCTDAPPYHNRCLLLHLSLMKVWMVPVVFGTDNSMSVFPQNKLKHGHI